MNLLAALRSRLDQLAAESGAFNFGSLGPPPKGAGDRVWRPDAAAELTLFDGRPMTLAVVVRQRINPAEMVPLAVKMADLREGVVPVLYCPAISARVAEICRDRGIGYLDEAGN